MNQGAQGAVKAWPRQKTSGPQGPRATQIPVRENERLRGNRSDAQRRKRVVQA